MRPGRIDGEVKPITVANASRLRLRQNQLQVCAAGMDVDDGEIAERLDQPAPRRE